MNVRGFPGSSSSEGQLGHPIHQNKTMEERTKEAQYQSLIELEKQGLEQLGLMSSYAWSDDPRHLLFILARYKFAAKMFSGMKRVMEVGCADAFGTRLVRQEVSE